MQYPGIHQLQHTMCMLHVHMLSALSTKVQLIHLPNSTKIITCGTCVRLTALPHPALAIKALVPGLTLPSILVPSISAALLNPEAKLNLPLFTIPSAQMSSIKQLLANLTALPTIIATVENTLPSLSLSGLTIPNLKTITASWALCLAPLALCQRSCCLHFPAPLPWN
ncbi:hypothetical protein COO60DRAFT_743135 [Scenedesmus sp. NREL 46B-D3]|nr:hypothetical protein COO60DRAFT_743135 [Scenedesmus sp. NREL 46B-D3]